MTKKRGKKKITLKKLAVHDTLWHEDSRLVFKSKTQKLVVGLLGDDDKSIVVNDETLDLCEKWGFKIDPALVESESDDDREAGHSVSRSGPEAGQMQRHEKRVEEHSTFDPETPTEETPKAPVSKSKIKELEKKGLREEMEAALGIPPTPTRSELAAKLLTTLATVSEDLAQTLHNLESKVGALTSELAQEKQARKQSDEKLERIRRQFFD